MHSVESMQSQANINRFLFSYLQFLFFYFYINYFGGDNLSNTIFWLTAYAGIGLSLYWPFKFYFLPIFFIILIAITNKIELLTWPLGLGYLGNILFCLIANYSLAHFYNLSLQSVDEDHTSFKQTLLMNIIGFALAVVSLYSIGLISSMLLSIPLIIYIFLKKINLKSAQFLKSQKYKFETATFVSGAMYGLFILAFFKIGRLYFKPTTATNIITSFTILLSWTVLFTRSLFLEKHGLLISLLFIFIYPFLYFYAEIEYPFVFIYMLLISIPAHFSLTVNWRNASCFRLTGLHWSLGELCIAFIYFTGVKDLPFIYPIIFIILYWGILRKQYLIFAIAVAMLMVEESYYTRIVQLPHTRLAGLKNVYQRDFKIEKKIMINDEFWAISNVFVNVNPYGLRQFRMLYSEGYVPINLNSNGENLISNAILKFTKNNKRALIIGLGSGASNKAIVKNFKHVDIVDISKASFEISKYLKDYNDNIMNQKNVSFFNEDGLRFMINKHMRDTGPKYDLVFFTPNPLFISQSYKMYTKESFYYAKSLLAPNGLFAYWGDSQVPADFLINLNHESAKLFKHVYNYKVYPDDNIHFTQEDSDRLTYHAVLSTDDLYDENLLKTDKNFFNYPSPNTTNEISLNFPLVKFVLDQRIGFLDMIEEIRFPDRNLKVFQVR